MDYGILSIFPIICAIMVAVAIRQVALGLFSALLLAALFLSDGSLLPALHLTIEDWLLNSLYDKDHLKILLFSFFIAGTIGLLNASHAASAFISLISRWANNRTRAQVSMWGAGLVVFFDDYANCLIVGNCMRKLADTMRISREKLAYIVDATAAPIASVSLVSTWIAFQVGLLDTTFKTLNMNPEPYEFFIESIPYNFYALFTLFFVFLVARFGFDFGPMAKAESKALSTPILQADERSINLARGSATFLLPILTLLGTTFASLYIGGTNVVGSNAPLFKIIGSADAYDSMVRGSFAALFVALVLTLGLRMASLEKGMKAVFDGIRNLIEPLAILILAWALSSALGQLGTAAYMVQVLGSSVPEWSLPTIIFITSALLAFATGTSFGTLGLMIPLGLPLAVALTDSHVIHLACTAAIMGGAVLGDHASPISDTTIMSSMGAGCDHVEHVKTQLPYVTVVGLICIFFGTLPVSLGVPLWLCLCSGLAACFLSLHSLSRFSVRLHLARGVA